MGWGQVGNHLSGEMDPKSLGQAVINSEMGILAHRRMGAFSFISLIPSFLNLFLPILGGIRFLDGSE